ncbi:hypothetical protein yrohd0001_12560 [Yersinia rohdei ATCC 43380]|nr:hypothetical protein yrohd0001_12560 [Yersinia rohdei ATCC 43380]
MAFTYGREKHPKDNNPRCFFISGSGQGSTKYQDKPLAYYRGLTRVSDIAMNLLQ